jgi:hypothetical protein
LRGGSLNSQKLAETLTAHGFEAGSLVEKGFPAKALALMKVRVF